MTCPHFPVNDLGRARELDAVTRPRRRPCKHWVTVTVARTYSGGAA